MAETPKIFTAEEFRSTALVAGQSSCDTGSEWDERIADMLLCAAHLSDQLGKVKTLPEQWHNGDRCLFGCATHKADELDAILKETP